MNKKHLVELSSKSIHHPINHDQLGMSEYFTPDQAKCKINVFGSEKVKLSTPRSDIMVRANHQLVSMTSSKKLVGCDSPTNSLNMKEWLQNGGGFSTPKKRDSGIWRRTSITGGIIEQPQNVKNKDKPNPNFSIFAYERDTKKKMKNNSSIQTQLSDFKPSITNTHYTSTCFTQDSSQLPEELQSKWRLSNRNGGNFSKLDINLTGAQKPDFSKFRQKKNVLKSPPSGKFFERNYDYSKDRVCQRGLGGKALEKQKLTDKQFMFKENHINQTEPDYHNYSDRLMSVQDCNRNNSRKSSQVLHFQNALNENAKNPELKFDATWKKLD